MSKVEKKENPSSIDNMAAVSGKTQASAGNLAGIGNLDKIRDILFGSQMRVYEKRFNSIEERLLKEISNLRNEIRNRCDSIENYIKKEVELLSDRIKAEQDTRVESVKEISQELKDTGKSFEHRMSQMDDLLNKTSRDLRQQILDQSKNLSDEIRQKNEECLTLLEQRIQEFRADKVDRLTLSEFFTQMAMNLTDDMSIGLNLDAKDLENE